MKMAKHAALAFLLLLGITLAAPARDIAPFVSTDWLQQNLNTPGVLVVDVRRASEYEKGHMPGAVNTGVDLWATNKNELLRELPTEKELFDLLGSLGIKKESKVVVVSRGTTEFDRADAIRVAWTMLAAGVRNVSVLDGGFAKWQKDGKVAVGGKTAASPGQYDGKADWSVVASKKYVLSRIGKAMLVDTRNPEIYFGVATEGWAEIPGHITSAVNLPAPWAFGEDGMLRRQSDLESMVKGVAGGQKAREHIIYCGVGPYAMAWSYLMTELLGYKDVKVYDGSMQEWVKDPAGPVALYGWR